jgi:hypothetical protein
MHRWIWNLHYSDPSVLMHQYPISAIYMDTPRLPLGPAALPGAYTVRLTVDGRSYTQPLVVKMDPRVHTSDADLQQQFGLATHIASMIERDFDAIVEGRALLNRLEETKTHAPNASTTVRAAIDTLHAHVEALRITRLNNTLGALLETIDGVDARPTTQATAAVASVQQQLDSAIVDWNRVKGPELNSLNAKLRTAGIPAVAIPADLTPYRNSLQQGETADKDDNDP